MTVQRRPRGMQAVRTRQKSTLAVPRTKKLPKSVLRSTPGKPGASTDVLGEIYATITEAALQRSIRTYLTRRGFTVWVFPIMKRTMAGVPDLTFWHVKHPGRLYCWELKRERKYVVSDAQVAALAHLATVPGVDARIVRPSDWPALREALEHLTSGEDS